MIFAPTAPHCTVILHACSANRNYLGPTTPDELALQIARAAGPSGESDVFLIGWKGMHLCSSSCVWLIVKALSVCVLDVLTGNLNQAPCDATS